MQCATPRLARPHLTHRPPPCASFFQGTVVVTPDGGTTWTGMEVNSSAPCAGSANPNVPLVPRDNAYAVGIVNNRGVGGGDRIIVLGGDATEDNVYFSDDGGLTFSCYDGPQIWSARGYALIAHPTGIFPGDPVFMMGGYVDEQTPSIGMFVNTGDGTANWVRPTCPAGNCGVQECGDSPGTYCLPSTALPGQVAWTWDTMYLWADDAANTVYELNAANYGQGWAVVGTSAAGVPGSRRVFIKGPNAGSGCFFSTDFTASGFSGRRRRRRARALALVVPLLTLACCLATPPASHRRPPLAAGRRRDVDKRLCDVQVAAGAVGARHRAVGCARLGRGHDERGPD